MLICLASVDLSIERHRNLPRYHSALFVLVNAIQAWPVTEIIHHLNMTGRQGPSERRSRPRLREWEGPAAVAVGRIAPTGRTAPKAPAGIICPAFL